MPYCACQYAVLLENDCAKVVDVASRTDPEAIPNKNKAKNWKIIEWESMHASPMFVTCAVSVLT